MILSVVDRQILRPSSDFQRRYPVSTCSKFYACELSSKIFDLPPRTGCALQGRAHRGIGSTLLQGQITPQCLTLQLHISHLFLTLLRGAVYTSPQKSIIHVTISRFCDFVATITIAKINSTVTNCCTCKKKNELNYTTIQKYHNIITYNTDALRYTARMDLIDLGRSNEGMIRKG